MGETGIPRENPPKVHHIEKVGQHGESGTFCSEARVLIYHAIQQTRT